MPRLSLRTKLELIEYHERKRATQQQTATKFNTAVTTVHKTLKNKCFWVKLYNGGKNGRSKKFSFSENAVIVSEMAKWYSELKVARDFSGVTKGELRKKLRSVTGEHNIDFKASREWMNQFVENHAVILRKDDSGIVLKCPKLKPKEKQGEPINKVTNKKNRVAGNAKIKATTPRQRRKGKFKIGTALFAKAIRHKNTFQTSKEPIKEPNKSELVKTESKVISAPKKTANGDNSEHICTTKKAAKKRRKNAEGQKSIMDVKAPPSIPNDIQIKPKTCYAQENIAADSPKQGIIKSKDVFEFDADKEDGPIRKKPRKTINSFVNNRPAKKILTRGRTRSLSFSNFENVTSRITRGTIKNADVHEMLLPPTRRKRKRSPEENTAKAEKHQDVVPETTEEKPLASPKKTRSPGRLRRKSLRLNPIKTLTTDDDDFPARSKGKIVKTTPEEKPLASPKKPQSLCRSGRKSLRLNPIKSLTTDDDDCCPEVTSARRPRRRRKKANANADTVIKEQFHDSGTFEDDPDFQPKAEQPDEIDYYEAIENDNVVEIVCSKSLCDPPLDDDALPKKSKIEILSNIQIISGSTNIVSRKQRSKSEGSSKQTEEHLFKAPLDDKESPAATPAHQNCDVSWSNLFPELDQTVSADELVNQINEIQFQYDPDAFKNLKIEVLSSGYTDEDEENDGAEGDDELEDDDVPSSQGQPMPPPNQMPQPPNSMQGGYRPLMPPTGRAPPPRGPQPGAARMPGGPRPPLNNRAPGVRPRAPMIRARGASAAQPVRGQMRPRMGGPQNGLRQTSPIKRTPDQTNAALQAKRKKVDVLTPSDKDDDDCQVICMQPKNTGLPQIESVQGGPESVENSIMKLSDSITLSVRNPPPKPVSSPQKSDAKAVANVLASRGITVTASAKPKESPTKQAPALPTALSLNGAVSIVASQKSNSPVKSAPSDNLPTVDLTDDTPPANNSPGKNRPGLPYRCDLCPAQYPNAMGLNKHRQSYHKTTSGMCELGVPLINIKQPGILQKLSQMGINNYIPLPSAGPEGTYALPIISTKNPGNVAALGATQMLSLGPVRTIPRPGAMQASSNVNTVKK